MSKTITLPAKKTLSTKEFQNLKKDDGTPEAESAVTTHQPEQEQKLMHISIETYVASLQTALASAKYALNMQLAVSMAVFHEHGGPTRSAKRFLYQVYDKAGWNCATPNDIGYKSVSRRVFAANLLYLHIGADRVNDEIAGAVEGQLIVSLVNMLTPMNITSVDNLLQTVGRPRIAAKSSPQQIEGEQPKQPEGMPATEHVQQLDKKQEGEPEGNVPKANAEQQLEPGEIVLPEEPEGKAEDHAEKELPDDIQGPRWMRRVGDNPDNIFKTVDTQHIHIALSKDADRTEIIAAAMKLLSIAEEMNNGHEGAIEVKGALQTELSKLTEEAPLQAELRNVPEPMKKPRGRRVITR